MPCGCDNNLQLNSCWQNQMAPGSAFRNDALGVLCLSLLLHQGSFKLLKFWQLLFKSSWSKAIRKYSFGLWYHCLFFLFRKTNLFWALYLLEMMELIFILATHRPCLQKVSVFLVACSISPLFGVFLSMRDAHVLGFTNLVSIYTIEA